MMRTATRRGATRRTTASWATTKRTVESMAGSRSELAFWPRCATRLGTKVGDLKRQHARDDEQERAQEQDRKQQVKGRRGWVAKPKMKWLARSNFGRDKTK
ncbi:hypothetical protein SPRG_16635 [Saprolegnia parasitica CBS 223.65]|uniref:Uncharacterized protein n=1 Tax=Saprolegnia parasitica (strain CBS 223.65) TaxID=695850 RepID=A0A067BTI9_SAPPC|nr:hypothetical protein SPRG_16635 [Saprolegnia parasitica CBS 223.65]KDO17962.1 hypothetical protein SPRG_16635 [Saprolegnia parasitica CBS 223.65]|eukprot:XP_012211331.1 hypothetical protein SPRG_16635 [Saprolegnia parasitica CBS 223.65]